MLVELAIGASGGSLLVDPIEMYTTVPGGRHENAIFAVGRPTWPARMGRSAAPVSTESTSYTVMDTYTRQKKCVRSVGNFVVLLGNSGDGRGPRVRWVLDLRKREVDRH